MTQDTVNELEYYDNKQLPPHLDLLIQFNPTLWENKNNKWKKKHKLMTVKSPCVKKTKGWSAREKIKGWSAREKLQLILQIIIPIMKYFLGSVVNVTFITFGTVFDPCRGQFICQFIFQVSIEKSQIVDTFKCICLIEFRPFSKLIWPHTSQCYQLNHCLAGNVASPRALSPALWFLQLLIHKESIVAILYCKINRRFVHLFQDKRQNLL